MCLFSQTRQTSRALASSRTAVGGVADGGPLDAHLFTRLLLAVLPDSGAQGSCPDSADLAALRLPSARVSPCWSPVSRKMAVAFR
jgi:hypothetical protein